MIATTMPTISTNTSTTMNSRMLSQNDRATSGNATLASGHQKYVRCTRSQPGELPTTYTSSPITTSVETAATAPRVRVRRRR